MRESVIEDYLADRVKAAGGEVRKVRWIGRRGAPDRLVMLPGRSCYVELKRPGEGVTPLQMREHVRMRRAGLMVAVASTFEHVDEILAHV